MCKFWFNDIFELKILSKFEYIMRLDCDSLILNRIKTDYFKFMKQHHKYYGYLDSGWERKFEDDKELCTKNIAKFSVNFIRKYKPPFAKVNNLVGNKCNLECGYLPVYYNNFEIIHMATFLKPKQKHFRSLVLKNKDFYNNRWGDAELRALQVQMFMNKNLHTQKFCDFDYYHEHHQRYFFF